MLSLSQTVAANPPSRVPRRAKEGFACRPMAGLMDRWPKPIMDANPTKDTDYTKTIADEGPNQEEQQQE